MKNITQSNIYYTEMSLFNFSESDTIEQLNRNMTAAVLPVTVFIGIETIVGLIGNILILLIYTKRYDRSNFRYFVLSMAVVDLTSCLTTLPGEIFSQMNWYDYHYGWICKVKSYFNVFTAWGSASILLLLAFDRYRKICKPLAWQIQPSLARKLCGCSLAISAVVASPIVVLWGKQTYMYEFEGHNLTVSICEKSNRYANDNYPLIYIGCVYMFPIGLILFVVCSLNFIIVKELFGSKKLLLSKCRKLKSSCPSASVTTLSTVCSEIDNNNTDKSSGQSESARERNFTLKSNCPSASVTTFSTVCSEIDYNNTDKCAGQSETARKRNITEKTSESSDDEFPQSCSRNQSETQFGAAKEVAETQGSVTISVTSDSLLRVASKSEVTFESDVQVNFDIVSRTTESDERSEDLPCRPQTVTENNLCGSISGSKSASRQRHNKQQQQQINETRRKQKTIIMLVLTSVFVTTMLMYVILISFVAGTEGILKDLSNSKKVVFFFFWRLYFINTVVNPVLYGFVDPRFRDGLKSLLSGKGVTSKRNPYEDMHRRSCNT